jgi:hypothetical protein
METEEHTWMKKCCGLCPYAKEGTLFLHPERTQDFAYSAENPYTNFPCHKTAEVYEDDYDGSAEYISGEASFTCHGFKTLQMASNAREGMLFDKDGLQFWVQPHNIDDEWLRKTFGWPLENES